MRSSTDVSLFTFSSFLLFTCAPFTRGTQRPPGIQSRQRRSLRPTNWLSAMHRFHLCARVLLCIALLLPFCVLAADTGAPSIFLVAKPELQDPNFAQSVVLVVFPKAGSPVGVIL